MINLFSFVTLKRLLKPFVFVVVRFLHFLFSWFCLHPKAPSLAIYSVGNRSNIIDLLLKDLIYIDDSYPSLFAFYYSTFALLVDYIRFDVKIICSHYALVRDLSLLGVKLSRVSSLYTHSCLDRIHFYSLKNCSKLFVLNNSEISFLRANCVCPSKLVYFPVGIDTKLLADSLVDVELPSFDVVFSLSYTQQSERSHYYVRKRYPFVVDLINMLTASGLHVAIIGSNWDACPFLNRGPGLFVFSYSYPDYMPVYAKSKIYCMPSLLEGSPTGFAEAMLAGCHILSSPTGWALDLIPSADYGIVMLNFSEELEPWLLSVRSLMHESLSSHQQLNRQRFLQQCDFSNLKPILISCL